MRLLWGLPWKVTKIRAHGTHRGLPPENGVEVWDNDYTDTYVKKWYGIWYEKKQKPYRPGGFIGFIKFSGTRERTERGDFPMAAPDMD
jgi:hypothetical protein